MSPLILGFAVLVYAALTCGAVLLLGRFALGQWDNDWWALGETALWLAFASGGFGLILDRAWSRSVLLIAAAVSIAESTVGMVLMCGWACLRPLVCLTPSRFCHQSQYSWER